MVLENLGDHIRTVRKARGLSQEALARRADVSLNLVGKLELGMITNPHYTTLAGIARALDVRVEELVEPEASTTGKASTPPETGLAADKAGAPQLTMEQFAAHGIQPTSAEVATLNEMLKAYTELAQTGAKKTKVTIPEGPVKMERVELLIDYACMSGMLTQEDLTLLAYGVKRELAASGASR